MRRLSALVIGLVAALLLSIGLVSATVEEGTEPTPDSAVGVHYQWGSAAGALTIVGMPGESYEAHDAAGRPVAAGLLDCPFVAILTPHAGFGPDGVIMRVRVGPDVLAVTDPEWEWN